MIDISEITKEIPKTQDPLEQKVYTMLEKQKISFERVENEPVYSMEECACIDKKLGTEIRKSIFLTNSKKTSFFLVVLPAHKPLDQKALGNKIGISHLSFASESLMEKHLGTKSGEATIMGLLNDEDDYVQLILDEEIVKEEFFGCNTGKNTSHIKIKTDDLLKKVLPYMKHKPKIVAL